MAKITNNYVGPLVIGNVEIDPGKTAEVENWSALKDAGLYPAWLAAGVISTGDDGESAGGEVEGDQNDRDQIIADLEEMGIKADKRKSTEALAEILNAALIEDADDEGEVE